MSGNDAYLRLVKRARGNIESISQGVKPKIGWHDGTRCPDCPACRKIHRLVKDGIDADANAIRAVSEVL